MKKVAIYTRRSYEKKDDNSISHDMQFKKCEEYCKCNNLKIIIRYEENKSGYTTKRKEFKSMIKALQDNIFDGIVVYDVSRLTRNKKDAEDIYNICKAKRKKLYFVCENFTNSSRNSKEKLLAIAEFEQNVCEEIGRRTKHAKNLKRKKGEFLGGKTPPYGYDRDGKMLIRNEEEQKVIRLMRKLYNKNKWSYEKITIFLNDKGIKSKNRGKWNKGTVKKIIKREETYNIYIIRLVAYGYSMKRDERVINEEEQNVIKLMLHLREKLKFKYQEIANYLNKKGIKTRCDNLWLTSTVYKIIKDNIL